MTKSLTPFFAVCAAIFVGTIALSSHAATATEGWGDNYKKAIAQSKAEKKLLLINFTGSDWCPWCIRLDKEVFSQPEFKKYAAKNLVLMVADFPQLHPQSDKLKAQNEALQKKYEIEGFPMVLVLDSHGKRLGVLGYEPGGVKTFLASLEKLKK